MPLLRIGTIAFDPCPYEVRTLHLVEAAAVAGWSWEAFSSRNWSAILPLRQRQPSPGANIRHHTYSSPSDNSYANPAD